MTNKSVPFFNYQAVYKQHQQEYQDALNNVLNRGAFILQQELKDFEKNLAEYLGVKHAFGVANCTDALIIALRLADLKAGDEVIISSHTFIATASAIHFLNAKAVPVECGPDRMIDPESVKKAITSKTKIIMPTQLNGRTCNMDALQTIASENNLKIVEDSAQGLGSKFKNKFAGTFGRAGSFSFYPAKVLNCFGDGGAMITNDNEAAEIIYQMRDHGRNHQGQVVSWGINTRLDNLQAAILNINLKYYDESIKRRRQIAGMYHAAFKNLEQLGLPPKPDADVDYFDVFQNYEITALKRDELRKYLSENKIGTLIQWGGTPVHQFKQLGFDQKLPYTDEFFKKCILLPMNTMLSDDDVNYVIERVTKFYN